MEIEMKWRIAFVLILLAILLVLWFHFFDYESWVIHILKLAGVMALTLCIGIILSAVFDYLGDRVRIYLKKSTPDNGE